MNAIGALAMAAAGFMIVAIAWLVPASFLAPQIALIVAVLGITFLGAGMGLVLRRSRPLFLMVLPLDLIAIVALVDLVCRAYLHTTLLRLITG